MFQFPFFAVVYWIDGVWKTSLVQWLVKKLRVEYACIDFDAYKKESHFKNPFSEIKKDVAQIDDPLLEFLNSTNSTLLQSIEIKKLLASWISVIKDRWRYDVCAHAMWRWCDQVISIDQILQGSLALPTHTILLTARQQVRRERIIRRWIANEYDMIENILGTRLYWMDQYMKQKQNLILKLN